MKTLNEYEAELNKCSKCGLCESVCPLFKIIPNDCVASKGKFIMLHGVTKGDLKLSKTINKYLDLCLKCGRCRKYCPSDIDVCAIINTAKYEYMEKTWVSKVVKFFQSEKFFSVLLKIGAIVSSLSRPVIKTKNETRTKVLYFKGCVNKVCPKTDKYLKKILKKSDISVIQPDFDCCGLPFLSEGNMERFLAAAEKNLEFMKQEYDYLVTDCASCQDTILDYPKYVEPACEVVSPEKIINWGDLIAEKNIKFKFKKPIKVTFHRPCHLRDDSFFKKIIENCENVEYVEMDDYDDCCGFAGSFAIKHHNLSVKIADRKARNIIKTKANYVITTCPACKIGLKHGLFLYSKKPRVVSLLEFLSMAKEIQY